MRVLILGGAGAIGSAIARHADDAGIETHVGLRPGSSPLRLAGHPRILRHACDVTEPESVEAVLDRVRPDWLVVAALPQAGHAATAHSRRALLLGMCDGLLAVLEAARASGFAGPLTWIGSAMCYGVGGEPRRTGATLQPQTFRGAVKAAESILAAQLATQFGIALTEIRVFTGYGPFEQRERLVASLLRAALVGGRVPLAAVPARRDWIHYEDIARACVASATAASAAHGVFNACTGRLRDTREVAALLEHITGRALVADEPYGRADAYGDAEPGVLPVAGDGLDWTPRIDLAEGLDQAWRWACMPEGRAYLLQDGARA